MFVLCGLLSHAIDVKMWGSGGLPRCLWHRGGWCRDPGRATSFHAKNIWFTGEMTKGAATAPPHPQVRSLVSRHLFSQGFVAPGCVVDGPAGDTEEIQQWFSEFRFALSLHSSIFLFCLLLKVDPISFNYVAVRKGQGTSLCSQINE